ncbi:MAG: MFS transporter, partial [Alphaproteobacteria bacterium]|nr:MFS transporter [Alphaproteobacteria bacterium]
FWFQAAYALGYLVFGRIVDRVGARIGFTMAVIIWTLAHMAHGLARSAAQFMLARVALGIGESGGFPASLKAVAEWFPQRERALAIGIFNAGTNIGAVITPLIVPGLVLHYGWPAAFYVTGGFGLVWLLLWWILYRRPEESKRVSASELNYIRQDGPDPSARLGWFAVMRYKETWAYAIAKFFIDPIWWFYLFWLPGYLFDRYHLDLLNFGLPIAAIYMISDLGSMGGGWLSSALLARGVSVNLARKLSLLVFAIAVLPIIGAQSVSGLWSAVAIIGLATAAHQAFSANIYALPADLFPRSAVGSVVGIGGTAGAIGGMLFAKLVGAILDASHNNYALLFALAGGVYLVALLAVHLLSPRLRQVKIEQV